MIMLARKSLLQQLTAGRVEVSFLSHATVIDPLTDRLRVSFLSHATVIDPLTDRLRVSFLSHSIVISPP
jgi:hypothetical protein